MNRMKWIVGFLVLSLCLLPAAAEAQQEHGGKEHKGGVTAAPAATQEHEGQTPATPALEATTTPQPPLPPALKPITITFAGDLTEMNTQASLATLTVQDRYGVKKEIAVPADVKVTQGAAAKALSDLKAGDKLTVEYTYDVATGKRTAQAISMGESTAAAR